MAAPDLERTRSRDEAFFVTSPESIRKDAAQIWAMRAGLELSVGAGYAVITRELFEWGADKSVLALCTQSAAEEVEHAGWCLLLAQRLDGVARDWPRPTSLSVPGYVGVERGPLLAALHLTAMSCLNETIACVRLLEASKACTCPSAKAVLHSILSDEIRHARAGWAHLASRYVTPEMRAAISGWIPAMLRASARSLIEENETIPSEDYRVWGLPPLADARAQAQRAIDEVVLPGFAELGILVPPVIPGAFEV